MLVQRFWVADWLLGSVLEVSKRWMGFNIKDLVVESVAGL